jgi:type II secretory pathway pseudopilin PulG
MNWKDASAILIVLVLLGIAVTFFVRLIVAIFSKSSRTAIAQRPVFHLVWGCASVSILFLILCPVLPQPTVGTRKASMSNLGTNLILALKGYKLEFGEIATGNNAELTAILKGKNRRGIIFMEFTKKDLNAQGEMIDPWNTPLLIRYLGSTLVVSSAGPDRKWNTKDDLVFSRELETK